MPELHRIESPTLNAILDARVAENKPRHGYRIPASQIGSDCARALFYDFWWITAPEVHSGQQLRLFETGNIEEERLVADLERAGLVVVTHDPDKVDDEGNPKQIGVSFADGHGYGYLDGEVAGVIEAPKKIHVMEAKSHNDASFKALLKAEEKHGVGQAVKHAKPEHYGQCQVYMAKRGKDRALYIAVNKNTDQIFVERIEYDYKHFEKLDRLARRIWGDTTPPARISDKPEFFRCSWCRHKDYCHDLSAVMPERNCRTCIFSQACDGGEWLCRKHRRSLDREAQNAGCGDHLFNPNFIKGQQVDFNLSEGWIEYAMPSGETFTDKAPGGSDGNATE